MDDILDHHEKRPPKNNHRKSLRYLLFSVATFLVMVTIGKKKKIDEDEVGDAILALKETMQGDSSERRF